MKNLMGRNKIGIMTKWTDHAKAVYQKGKKKNAAYKFSQALKDAAKTWKKAPKGKVAKAKTGGYLAGGKKKRQIRR